MKSVSANIKKAVKNGSPVYAYAKITLRDQTELTLTSNSDFFISNNSYNSGAGDGFPMGTAICKAVTFSIDNTPTPQNPGGRFSMYDFYGAQVRFYSEVDTVTGTDRSCFEGYFTIIDSVTPGDVIEITAYDAMYKADTLYNSALVFPATLDAVLTEVCTQAGLIFSTDSYLNENFTVKAKPEGKTCREIIAAGAQIACGNALIIGANTVKIKSYNFSQYNSINIISGGTFTDAIVDTISGGNFGESISDTITPLFANDDVTVPLDSGAAMPTIGTDDITITGVYATGKNSNNEDVRYIYGTDDYAISLQNPLISGNENAAVNSIGSNVVGVTLRPFNGNFAPCLEIEPMDTVILTDSKGAIYQSIASNVSLNYLGNSVISNNLPSPERNKASYTGTSAQINQTVATEINIAKTQFETSIQEINDELDAAGGLYETTETPTGGGTVYYFHDKPDLADSRLVIKITNQAIGVSTTGSTGTYDYGLNLATSSATLNQLIAHGVSADFVNTGILSADYIEGGTLTLGGNNNVDGEMSVYDGRRNKIGSWDSDGFLAENISIGNSGDSAVVSFMPSQIATGDGLAIIEGSTQWSGLFKTTTRGVATSPVITHTSGAGEKVDVYVPIKFNSSIDANNQTISNATISAPTITNAVMSSISSIGSVNGNIPKTGQVQFVKEITVNNGVVTSVTTGTLTFTDGILTGW